QRAGWPAPGSAGDESGCCARSRQGGQGAHRADGRRGHSLAETLSEREPPAADERAPECDAVPESPRRRHDPAGVLVPYQTLCAARGLAPAALAAYAASRLRSEEHTSELQSRENLVCRLLLEKKKQKNNELCS